MGHTSEERDHLRTPLCGAGKRSGGTCRAFAGQGTQHPGVGRCKYHGGNSPNGRKHAAAIDATKRMVKLGQPLADITPQGALLGVLRATAGHVAWLHSEVATLDDLSEHEAQVVIRLYAEERDRLSRIADACSRSGLAESQIKIATAQSELLGRALVIAADAAGLDRDEKRRLGSALRAELDRFAREPETQSIWAAPLA